ncbi:hypothetical protein HK405_003629, partial [Cladochytrium tenue]
MSPSPSPKPDSLASTFTHVRFDGGRSFTSDVTVSGSTSLSSALTRLTASPGTPPAFHLPAHTTERSVIDVLPRCQQSTSAAALSPLAYGPPPTPLGWAASTRTQPANIGPTRLARTRAPYTVWTGSYGSRPGSIPSGGAAAAPLGP